MLPALDEFLTNLAQANRSPHTVRIYGSDLRAFDGEPTATGLRIHFARFSGLAASTRARKRAAFSAYDTWVVRQELRAWAAGTQTTI